MLLPCWKVNPTFPCESESSRTDRYQSYRSTQYSRSISCRYWQQPMLEYLSMRWSSLTCVQECLEAPGFKSWSSAPQMIRMPKLHPCLRECWSLEASLKRTSTRPCLCSMVSASTYWECWAPYCPWKPSSWSFPPYQPGSDPKFDEATTPCIVADGTRKAHQD